MNILLIAGNLNRHTFGNAIVAADHQARKRRGSGLDRILVVHSLESRDALTVQSDWRDYIEQHQVSSSILVEITTDPDQQEWIPSLTDQIRTFLSGLDRKRDIYVDLTNGTSLTRSILSIISFIVGVQEQFILNTQQIPKPPRFCTLEELSKAYVALPNISILDKLALTSLTEVRRYGSFVEDGGWTFGQLSRSPLNFSSEFKQDLLFAFETWLQGRMSQDSAKLAAAGHQFGKLFDVFTKAVHQKVCDVPQEVSSRLWLRDRLDDICGSLEAINIDTGLLGAISTPLRQERNVATHELKSYSELERVRSRLSVEMFICFVQFFQSLLKSGIFDKLQGEGLKETELIAVRTQVFPPGHELYYGLDGDDTGAQLERLFTKSAADQDYTRYSKLVKDAIKAVVKEVEGKTVGGEVLFSAGDDVLFKCKHQPGLTERLMELYRQRTGGRTCSIGVGRSTREVYVALKIAKAQPGKNSCIGIEIVA